MSTYIRLLNELEDDLSNIINYDMEMHQKHLERLSEHCAEGKYTQDEYNLHKSTQRAKFLKKYDEQVGEFANQVRKITECKDNIEIISENIDKIFAKCGADPKGLECEIDNQLLNIMLIIIDKSTKKDLECL